MSDIRWLEDDSNLLFFPWPEGEPNPRGLIGYYELLEPPPLHCARIVDLKDPYEDP